VIDKNGKVIARFEIGVAPESERIKRVIESALAS
jgi:glutathione peroxidase-family protein